MRSGLFVLLAVTVGAGGCGQTDLCGGDELLGMTCLTLHVKGQLNPGETTVDNLQVDVTYVDFLGKTHVVRTLSRPDSADLAGVPLPISLALVLPNDARIGSTFTTRVVVLARTGSLKVGLGSANNAKIRTMPGEHGQLDIVLSPAAGDTCFNIGDCGTDRCPACAPGGDRCSSSNLCIDPFVCSNGSCVPGA